jgi:hypothetical protein
MAVAIWCSRPMQDGSRTGRHQALAAPVTGWHRRERVLGDVGAQELGGRLAARVALGLAGALIAITVQPFLAPGHHQVAQFSQRCGEPGVRVRVGHHRRAARRRSARCCGFGEDGARVSGVRRAATPSRSRRCSFLAMDFWPANTKPPRYAPEMLPWQKESLTGWPCVQKPDDSCAIVAAHARTDSGGRSGSRQERTSVQSGRGTTTRPHRGVGRAHGAVTGAGKPCSQARGEHTHGLGGRAPIGAWSA